MVNGQHCNLRRKTEFQKNNVKTVYYGTETLTFFGPRILEILPDTIKKSNNCEEFKMKIQLLVTELFKVKIGLLPPFMKKIFVENAQHCVFRRKTEFKRNNVKTVYHGTETLIFLGPRILEIVQDSIKKLMTEEFKLKIKL